jgi:hypothetical protein
MQTVPLFLLAWALIGQLSVQRCQSDHCQPLTRQPLPAPMRLAVVPTEADCLRLRADVRTTLAQQNAPGNGPVRGKRLTHHMRLDCRVEPGLGDSE